LRGRAAAATRATRAAAPRAVAHARSSARRPETIAAAVIVLAGLVLRIAFVKQWRPALIGYPDSGIYIEDAITGIFNNPLREGGYSELLRLLHAIRPHLAFVIEVQHIMGIASGLLLFGAIRRAGISARVALVPLAVVVLGGSELFVEHAPLTEAMFIFLIDLSLYCLMRTWTGGWRWAIIAGLALGVAVDTRSVALMLLPVLVVLSALFGPRPWHRRVICAAAATLAAAVPIGWYLHEHQLTQGYGGLTGARYFDFYARVAPFADCTKFTPPAGTRRLCITMPAGQRPGHDFWEFSGISPAVAVYGEPDTTVPQPNENAQLRAFAIAAILGQPDRYLEFVARDLVRIVDPSFPSTPYHGGITAQGYGSSPEGLLGYYFNPTFSATVQTQVSAYYPTDGTVHGGIGFFLSWERDTRIEGPLMALLLLLAFAAPITARGRERHAALLFGATTLVLLVGPILASGYDYRFTIPAFGSLAATAAIGGAVVARRLQRTKLASQIRARGLPFPRRRSA
jgi:4-amino-4-deoxy-L-arabinose transferase-like glycosyltransferase